MKLLIRVGLPHLRLVEMSVDEMRATADDRKLAISWRISRFQPHIFATGRTISIKLSRNFQLFSDWIRPSACTWNKRFTKKEAKFFLHVGSTLERRVASKFKIINRCALFEIELGAVQLKFDQRKSMATTINSLQRDRCTRMLTTSSSSSSTPSPCSTLTACSEIFASTAGRAEDNNW